MKKLERIGLMTRNKFLTTIFPIPPYVKDTSRMPSTPSSEGFHIQVGDKCLNFSWNITAYNGNIKQDQEGTVNVELVDLSKHERERHSRLFSGLKTLSGQKIEECYKII